MKTRTVHTRFWQDEFINTLTAKEKLLFIYLITNDRTSLTGMYELPDKYIRADIDMTQKELDVAKGKLSENNKILFHSSWIKIINHDKFNSYTGEKIDVAKEKEMALLPKELIEYQCPTDTSIDTSSDTPNKDISKDINYPINKDIDKVTDGLYEMIKRNGTDKKPTARDYQILEGLLKKYPKDEVVATAVFSQMDSFWKTNILSASGFKKHFEQLYAKAKAQQGGKVIKI